MLTELYSPPGSSVHGIFQSRILEWVAISFSRGSPGPRNWTLALCTAGRLCQLECVALFLLQGIFPTHGLKTLMLVKQRSTQERWVCFHKSLFKAQHNMWTAMPKWLLNYAECSAIHLLFIFPKMARLIKVSAAESDNDYWSYFLLTGGILLML